MTIEIRALRVEAIIGILDDERRLAQSLSIDCDLEYDYKSPEFIDYTLVSALIAKELIDGKFALIEDALDAITQKLLALSDRISRVCLAVGKVDRFSYARVRLCVIK
jgi:FolB domain-containing protein